MDILKYYHTVRHLKPIQIKYQIYYRLRKKLRNTFHINYPLSIEKKGHPVQLTPFIPKYNSFNNNTFTFLNLSKSFQENNIDWNHSEFGKLWTYNLNYFDFLLQENMQEEKGLQLIEDYISKLNNQSTGLEPYPISLRGINWIKFISNGEDFTQRSLRNNAAIAARNNHEQSLRASRKTAAHAARNHINASLYAQYQILLKNLEYHLLANHLLENAFSLLFGAFYFKDINFYKKANKILKEQLEEQILEDGAHFELSPMYHQILLDRLLDCINLLQNNKRFDDQDHLLRLLQTKAEKMLTWLNYITFSNGDIPLFNDACPNIAPTTQQLNNYALTLNTKYFILSETPNNKQQTTNNKLGESGYRRYNGKNYECILNIAPISPSYQPGHAHADSLSFVLYIDKKPFLIDPGISTYEAGSQRSLERGTSFHNTVSIRSEDSSKVWAAFRVARRAKVKASEDKKNNLTAEHDGYKSLNTIHKRNWEFHSGKINITDNLTGKKEEGTAHFWFHPSINIEQEGNQIKSSHASILFENIKRLRVMKTKIPYGYNAFQKTNKVEVVFNQVLKTVITIN